MNKEYYRKKIAARSKLSPAPDESKGVGVEFRPQGQEIEQVQDAIAKKPVKRLKPKR